MSDSNWDWVNQQEAKNAEEKSKDYFNITEGKQQFVLLSHIAPLAQVWDGKKYRAAEEGDKNISMKGVCWVLQDDTIKQAKLPYVVVKAIKGIAEDPDWDFSLPFTHPLSLVAVGAGTKEVQYTVTPSPKKIEIPPAIIEELKKKKTPEDIVDVIKGKVPVTHGSSQDTREVPAPIEYPEEEIDPKDIPF